MATAPPPRVLVICGGGTGAHVLIADLGDRPEWRIRLVTSRPEAWDGPVECEEHGTTSSAFPLIRKDAVETLRGRPESVHSWDDAASAFAGADGVFLVGPVAAHRPMLERILPALDRSRPVAVGSLFAQGGFDWIARDVLAAQPDADVLGPLVTLFGLKRYVYLAAKLEYGRRALLRGRYPTLFLALDAPTTEGAAAATELVAAAFRKPVVHLDAFVSCALNMSNQLLHPGLLWGYLHDYVPGETTYPEPPRLYGDANARGTGEMDVIYRDLYALVRALEPVTGHDLHRFLGVDPMMRGMVVLRTWLFRPIETTRLYQWAIATFGGWTLRHHGRLREVRVPMLPAPSGEGWVPNTASRIFTDDLAHGLCVLYGLGEIVGLKLDGIGRTIRRQQVWIGKKYLDEDGWGPDFAETNAPQRYGVDSPEALRAFLTPRYPNLRSGAP